MLIEVRSPTERPRTDLAGALLECHDRIRRFTDLAWRLATSEAPDAERAEVSRSVARYFSVALPLHAQDEDVSIAPRLVAFGAPPEVLEAARRMTREHGAIDKVLDALGPRWQALAADPASFAWQAAALTDGAARLRAVFEPHLALEESIVFPAIARVVPSSEIACIQLEMRARRAGPRMETSRGEPT